MLSMKQAWLEDGTEVFNPNTDFPDVDRVAAVLTEAMELNAEVEAFSTEVEAFLEPFVSEFLRKK